MLLFFTQQGQPTCAYIRHIQVYSYISICMYREIAIVETLGLTPFVLAGAWQRSHGQRMPVGDIASKW